MLIYSGEKVWYNSVRPESLAEQSILGVGPVPFPKYYDRRIRNGITLGITLYVDRIPNPENSYDAMRVIRKKLQEVNSTRIKT